MTDAPLETHVSITQPAPGRWLVIERDMERVSTRGGDIWRCRVQWIGCIASTVEESRASIEAQRERYDELTAIRAEHEAAHLRGVRAAERESVSLMLSRRSLANPDDPFACMRGTA